MTTYEEIVNLALRRGLFFPASEIYQNNAPAGFYDFGPFGATIRRKIIDVWRKTFVHAEDMLEIDGAVILPEPVFKASGHLEDFNDPMAQCRKCNTIFRADQLVEEKGKKVNEGTPIEELTKYIHDLKIKCPKCGGDLMDVRQFNLMVKAIVGSGSLPCYLRPESCQSIFTAWHRLMNTCRVKLPKGIAQVGKAFRNEISPRQTLLRQVEFYQMEAEIF
ncbi:glycine--tRNA ligase, partial [Candidatus Woesearchaeota archaeon]|nr:glycine--tRNA ligase [Candidatus Woesearchaeota archaeon]